MSLVYKSMNAFSGNLTRDGKLTNFTRPDGTINSRYQNTIAIDTGVKGPDEKNITNYLNFTLWGKRAETFAAQYSKGDRVHLTGEIVPNSFT